MQLSDCPLNCTLQNYNQSMILPNFFAKILLKSLIFFDGVVNTAQNSGCYN